MSVLGSSEEAESGAHELVATTPDGEVRDLASTLLAIALDEAREHGARAHRFAGDLVDAVDSYTPPRWILPPRIIAAFYGAFCAGWIEQAEDAERVSGGQAVS